ncbi:MAG: TonB-dependent receptor [Rhodothermales bacterium]|nr:TonB-dependent receptor [Rhodothermales bacterium]
MRYSMRLMNALAALALCLGLTTQAYAQTGRISGQVTDPAGQPLPGVNVIVAGTTLGAATNSEGRFLLPSVPAGARVVEVSMVGFQRFQRAVDLAAGQEMVLDVQLVEDVLQSDGVIIVANRREQRITTVPVSVAAMAPEELARRNVVSLDDALRHISGVQVQDNQISVRGSSGFAYNVGSRVLLLIDGVPLLSPDTDGVPYEGLPFAQVERLEVLKGPGSALYGSGALGGVVNLITRTFPSEPTTMVRAFAGAYEPVRYALWRERWDGAEKPRPFAGVTVSHARRVSERFGYWVDGAFRRSAGYMRLNEKTLVQTHGKIGWNPNADVRLDVLANVLWRKKDDFLFWNGARDALQPGSLAISSSSEPSGATDNESNQISLFPTLTHVLSPNLFYEIKTRGYAVGVRPIDTAGNVRTYRDGTYGFRYGGEYLLNWNPGPGRFLTGGASIDANSTRSSFFVSADGDPIGNQPEGAVFGQWEQTLGERFQLVAGLRFDLYRIDASDTVTKLSPKLNLAYSFTPNLTARAAYGQGFRIPSLGERFVDNRDFFPIVRNLTLRPEESTSYELGLRGLLAFSERSDALVDVAVFWNDYWRLIETRFVPAASAFQFVNLIRARVRGAEASIEAALLDGVATTRLGYTFLDARDLGAGEPLAFRPAHMLTVSADTRFGKRYDAGFDFRYASRPKSVNSDFARFVPDAETLIDTRVLDLRAGARFGQVRALLILRNALEYYYMERPALLAPPRHLMLQMQLDL